MLTRDDCVKVVEELMFPTAKAADPHSVESIGIELENFPYRHTKKGPQPVRLYGPGSTTEALMDITGKLHGTTWQTRKDEDGNEKIYRIDIGGNSFFFEPGGQVEISIRPCESIDEAEQNLQSMQSILAAIKDSHGICFGQRGIDPWIGKGELMNQLRFPRYKALQEYFDAIGPYGQRMMFHTCGLHINLDAGYNENTRVKRIAVSNLLSPFATALFANSPTVEHGEFKSYRSHIWRHTDPLRTGILRSCKRPDKQALVEGYVNFAMQAPLIYIPRLGDRVLPRETTMERWLEAPIGGIGPTIDDLKNHLTLLFPEVRMKGYLEIRSVDAPPASWQIVPLLFYSGILYSETQTEKALQLLESIEVDMDQLLLAASLGLKDDIIRSYATELMTLAIEGLNQLPKGFVEDRHQVLLNVFFIQFTQKQKSFADMDLFFLELL
jgi:glutamate--cysteine ligase